MQLTLTQQQDRALKLFTSGASMKEVALTLGVSYSRVVNILNDILIKTGLKTRKELLVKGKELKYEVKTA